MSVTYLRREPRRRLRQAGTRSRPAAGTTISTSTLAGGATLAPIGSSSVSTAVTRAASRAEAAGAEAAGAGAAGTGAGRSDSPGTSGFQPADRPGRPDPEALRGNQLSRSSRAPRSLVVQHRLAVTLCGQAVPDHDQKGKLLFLQ